MTKNEIVAKWLLPKKLIIRNHNFDDYNLLHEAWVKFRDLKFGLDGIYHVHYHAHCEKICNAIVYGTITEAFDELVKGIEWYNSLNDKA